MTDALSIIAAATGLPPAAIELRPRAPLNEHANRLYDALTGGRHWIVKEYLVPDEEHESAAREYKALQLLAPLDIAPRPVFFEPSLGPVVVYEFMEGEMWDRHRPAPAELAQLAETWLKMNSVAADDLWLSHGYERPLEGAVAGFQARFQAYSDWAAADFAPGRRAAEMCLGLLETRRGVAPELTGAAPPLCFCRADPRFANVIRRPDGRLGLVDWEDSGLRDPARDLADVMTHPNQEDLLSPEDWQAFLEPYLAERGPLDAGLMHRALLYQALFPIFWLSLAMNQGITLAGAAALDGWHINGLPANLRMRRYLARALAWPQLRFERELDALAGLDFFPVNG